VNTVKRLAQLQMKTEANKKAMFLFAIDSRLPEPDGACCIQSDESGLVTGHSHEVTHSESSWRKSSDDPPALTSKSCWSWPSLSY
jgi:hypothetical protein